MDDPRGRARQLSQPQEAADRLALDDGGAGARVPRRAGMTGGSRLRAQTVEHRAVFTVYAQNTSDLAHFAEQIVHFGVGEHERVIGVVRLERGHARVRHLVQLAAGVLVPVGDRHVEAVVAGAAAVRPAVPDREGLRQRAALVLGGKVDEQGRAAQQSGLRAGAEVIRRHRARDRHIEMGVAVDETREHQTARRVQNGVAREIRSLGRDPPVLQQQVGAALARAVDQRAAPDQCRHDLLPPLSPADGRWPAAVRRAGRKSPSRSRPASADARVRGSRRFRTAQSPPRR